MFSATLFRFVPGPWSPCSATCGPGRQTREVKCRVMLSFTKTEVDLPEEECGKDRPQPQIPCNQGPCTQVPGISSDLQDHGAPYIRMEEVYNWDYRSFTPCSATCAAGEFLKWMLTVEMPWTLLFILSSHVQTVLVYILCPGKQAAVVKCVNRKQGDEVEDSQCESSSKPPMMIRICNPEPCPPR